MYLKYENKYKTTLIPSHVCGASQGLMSPQGRGGAGLATYTANAAVHTYTDAHTSAQPLYAHPPVGLPDSATAQSGSPTNMQTANFDKILGSILLFSRDPNDNRCGIKTPVAHLFSSQICTLKPDLSIILLFPHCFLPHNSQ